MTCTADRHDTLHAYSNLGCRCPEAKRRAARRAKRWRLDKQQEVQLKYPALGLQRRIRALACIGWSQETLTPMLGFQISRPWPEWVRRRKYDAIVALYAELENTPGPDPRAKQYAEVRGWYPPACWDDIDDPDEVPAEPLYVAERRRARWRAKDRKRTA